MQFITAFLVCASLHGLFLGGSKHIKCHNGKTGDLLSAFKSVIAGACTCFHNWRMVFQMFPLFAFLNYCFICYT